MFILMLIEDNEDDVFLTLRAVRKICPECDIDVATDGQKGLDCIFNQECVKTIDLILLDLNLPKVNGLEILRKVKSDPVRAKIPVVILTSSSFEGDMRKAKEYGADMYVVKPLDPVEFRSKIREILNLYLPKR